MIRDIDLAAETDGKRYSYNDMARLGCNECEGCSDCCRSVEDTIVLDPFDVYNIKRINGQEFTVYSELGVVDGLILPHMKMTGDGGCCVFLNENGRCSIHKNRPGFCRLYPLGRLYEDGDYSYILLKGQCIKERTTKVKISKWLELEDPRRYHEFIVSWHYFTKALQDKIMAGDFSEEEQKQAAMLLLKIFYMQPYDTGLDFYEQYEERISAAKNMPLLGGLL